MVINVFTFIGAFFGPIVQVTSRLQCCQCCAIIGSIIMLGIARFSAEGKSCADNNSVIDDGTTFANHGTTLMALFIVQIVLIGVYFCCNMCQVGTAGAISGIAKPTDQ